MSDEVMRICRARRNGGASHPQLVGGFKHFNHFPFHIWDVILPIDFHMFSRWFTTTNQLKTNVQRFDDAKNNRKTCDPLQVRPLFCGFHPAENGCGNRMVSHVKWCGAVSLPIGLVWDCWCATQLGETFTRSDHFQESWVILGLKMEEN